MEKDNKSPSNDWYFKDKIESVMSVKEKNLKNCTKQMQREFHDKVTNNIYAMFIFAKSSTVSQLIREIHMIYKDR